MGLIIRGAASMNQRSRPPSESRGCRWAYAPIRVIAGALRHDTIDEWLDIHAVDQVVQVDVGGSPVAKVSIQAKQHLDKDRYIIRIDRAISIHVTTEHSLKEQVVESVHGVPVTGYQAGTADFNCDDPLAIRQFDSLEIGSLSKVADRCRAGCAAEA